MTISTTTIKNSYSGNGSTSVFNYTFKITDEDHITVIIRTDSTGAETTKTKTTHYTVSGVGNAGGGSVTFTSGNLPASGETVVLRRDTPQTQGMDLIENDPLPANTLETAHDKIMSVAQEVQEEVDRSIKLSRTNTMTSTEFTVGATDRANKILAFDSAGEISVTQELGTFKGTDATVTTAAYVQRDIIKSTTTAQLNNVYICVADSVVGDSLTDTDHFELLVDAVSAATSATSASTSATAAASSATAAASSASAASTSESNASSSASTASTKASEASTSASNASTSESNASTSETNAASSATAAASSATSASSSATTATTKASEASTSATNAASSATSASSSASTATTKASEAATSATNAATSETNAGNSATSAASSATAAASSATSASGSASTATTKASEASTSATNAASSASTATTKASEAASSATSASGSASTATTKASEAATSATNAASSASTATTKASEASTSASNAATSATNAASSATAAAASATSAANSFDDFDDTYLGAKSSDPSTDNDGDALATGMLYTNTTSGNLRYYNGSAWINVSSGLTSVSGDSSPSLGGDLSSNGNDIKFADNDKALFGTGDDTEIYNDGTSFYIDNNNGNIQIRTFSDDRDIFLVSDDGSGGNASYLQADGSTGSINLRHYGNVKLATASGGITVTGDIANSSGDLTLDVAGDINLDADGGDILFKDAGTEIGRFTNSSSNFVIKSAVSDKDLIIKGNDSGSEITVLTFDMSAAGEASFGNNVRVDDNLKIMAGTGNDLQISHDGSNSIINAAGTGGLLLQNNTNNQIVSIQSDDSSGGLTDYVKADGGEGEVLLYHYGNEKLKTQSDGLDVTGHIIPAANDTYDLGETGKVWRNIHTGDLHLSNEAKDEGNAVDGTKGNWTIQEGAEDLYILNNKTGKKFKFKLEEIS